MAKYKVMSRYLSVRTGSCHDACKGVECDQQTTRTRTSLLRKYFKWRTAGKARTQGNASSMSRSYKLGRRRYSEITIPGGAPIARCPLLDSATNKPTQGIRIAKDAGALALSKKKAIRKPANMEKIESELDYLRRNSTGNLGIKMGDSKVLTCGVSVPTGSCLDTGKAGAVRNLKTKAGSYMSRRSGNFRRLTTSRGEEMPACTKRLAISVSHQSDLKLKPLKEKAFDVSTSNKLIRRRHSDILISEGSPINQGSLLDATSAPNTGSRRDKDNGPYDLSKKKDMHMPKNLDKIESKVGYLRRNSTGSLGIEKGESKVLPCFQSVPTCSHKEFCKYTVERDLKPKERTLQPTRSVTTSGEVPEKATKVKLQIRKKQLNSSKQPKLKSRNTLRAQGQKIPAGTKVAISVNHQSDLKLKPLKYSASFMSKSNILRSRRYSDTLITGGSPNPRGSLFDGATSRSNEGSKTDKDTGSSELSKKKNPMTISLSTRSSAKRVSGKKSNNISLRMATQCNKRANFLIKTGKVRHEDDLTKESQLNNLTSSTRMEAVQPSSENIPNKASQLNKSASLKRQNMEQGSQGSVPKETLYIREPKTKSKTIKLTRETRKARVSSLDRLDRYGPKRGNGSSTLHSRSSSLLSDGSSSRNISNRKASLSSISACESLDGDTTVGSFRKSGITSQSQDLKIGRTTICSPKNLKFRRGKVIDFQSEKVSPRRLKFRPPKILDNSENGSAHVRGRSSRRLIAAGKSNAAKDEAMKFNLRHQARGNKKESPILFNNVIEETATKLVETRRSKVKALVGAFETIISLQDPRSSPPIIWR